MKKRNMVWIVGTMVLLAGCSPKKEAETAQTVSESMAEIETAAEASESVDSQAPADGKEEETRDAAKAEAEEKQDEAGEKADGEKTPETASDDNFSVASSDAEEFARQIKEAVAGKDLEGLAELAAYPLYIGFPDGGKSLESKEEFVALGAETIFTEELMDSVSQSAEDGLSPSRAGFVLTSQAGNANIVFSLRNGKLAISGINY